MATAENVEFTRLLGKCSRCSVPLPLRLPEAHEQALRWVCACCGTTCHGVLLASCPSKFRRNVRPEGMPSGHGELPIPPDASEDFAAGSEARHPSPISIAFPGHRGVCCELETAVSRQLDVDIERGTNLQIRTQGTPFVEGIKDHGDRPYEESTVSRFRELVRQASAQVEAWFASVQHGDPAELHVAESFSQDGLCRVAEDMDLLVSLGITPAWGGYPSRHALRVGMLAMAIGTSLGWDERTLLDLGIGCLVHDVGMLGVASAAYQSKRILSPSDFAEITKHPVLVLESLQGHHDEIAEPARMIAYQMHERCDGSGYPRGYRADRIHQLAKIAAVADVFVALVSPRPHRPGMVPYHALKKILHDTKLGIYDPVAVRGLLNTVSLFPIGSHVTLSDGRTGRVIRVAGRRYDRPVVELRNPLNVLASPMVVDLSEECGLAISNALASSGE